MTSAKSFHPQLNAVLDALKNEGVDFGEAIGTPGALWGLLAGAAETGISAKGLSALAHYPAFENHSQLLTSRHQETGVLSVEECGYMTMYLLCSAAGQHLQMAAMPLAMLRATKAGGTVSTAGIAQAHADLQEMATAVA